MIALDAVEAQLQAIAWECERLRRDNVPGYLVRQSLEQIEGRVAEIRRATRPAVERGGSAVLLVPAAGRRGVRDALARFLPDLLVLAEEEVGLSSRPGFLSDFSVSFVEDIA